MSVNCNTYVLIGTPLPEDWGSLPTDGQGDQDEYDDWHDRWGHLVIYQPKPGDIVYFDNIDGHNPYIGRVLAYTSTKWDTPEFNETFDVARLTREIEEVAAILQEKYGITSEVKLHFYTNVT